MKEESFNVDAFNERDSTGVLGRMADVLGNSLATSQIAIGKTLSNLVGDPSLGRKVDVISPSGNGVNSLYRVNVPGVSPSCNTRCNPCWLSVSRPPRSWCSVERKTKFPLPQDRGSSTVLSCRINRLSGSTYEPSGGLENTGLSGLNLLGMFSGLFGLAYEVFVVVRRGGEKHGRGS